MNCEASSTIDHLPGEFLVEIFRHLCPLQRLLTCRLVSRRWDRLVQSPELWSQLEVPVNLDWRGIVELLMVPFISENLSFLVVQNADLGLESLCLVRKPISVKFVFATERNLHDLYGLLTTMQNFPVKDLIIGNLEVPSDAGSDLNILQPLEEFISVRIQNLQLKCDENGLKCIGTLEAGKIHNKVENLNVDYTEHKRLKFKMKCVWNQGSNYSLMPSIHLPLFPYSKVAVSNVSTLHLKTPVGASIAFSSIPQRCRFLTDYSFALKFERGSRDSKFEIHTLPKLQNLSIKKNIAFLPSCETYQVIRTWNNLTFLLLCGFAGASAFEFLKCVSLSNPVLKGLQLRNTQKLQKKDAKYANSCVLFPSLIELTIDETTEVLLKMMLMPNCVSVNGRDRWDFLHNKSINKCTYRSIAFPEAALSKVPPFNNMVNVAKCIQSKAHLESENQDGLYLTGQFERETVFKTIRKLEIGFPLPLSPVQVRNLTKIGQSLTDLTINGKDVPTFNTLSQFLRRVPKSLPCLERLTIYNFTLYTENESGYFEMSEGRGEEFAALLTRNRHLEQLKLNSPATCEAFNEALRSNLPRAVWKHEVERDHSASDVFRFRPSVLTGMEL